MSTDKTVSETAAALQAAVQANHFGVMQIHNLKETMAKKGVEFARECLIFEVCQPQQAKNVVGAIIPFIPLKTFSKTDNEESVV